MPSGIVTTGWPAARATCRDMGIVFDPWQDGAGQLILAKRADGSYAATIGGVVISIPRQVGKTFLIGAIIFALCKLFPGLLVIWTAHQLATAGETFRAMQAMARKPKIRPHIQRVVLGSGDEAIEFKNGSRILFGARERGFGLGFTKVGVLVMDEAQRLTEKTMDDLVPTTNQADNPLIFLIGTPPRPTDRGETFRLRRKEALSGEADDMVYIEMSADADVQPATWAANHVDWDAVAMANPSFPNRTSKTAILRMLKNLGRESFGREGLGIWDDDRTGIGPLGMIWPQLAIEPDAVPTSGARAYGVAFSNDGMRLSLGGALVDGDRAHVEQIDAFAGALEAGLGPLADWFVEKIDGAPRWRRSSAIVLSGRAGASVLEQLLITRGVPKRRILLPNTPQYFQASAMLLNEAREAAKAVADGGAPTFTHTSSEGQTVLDASAATAIQEKRARDGAWGWAAPAGDETPVESISLALWGARTSKVRVGQGQKVTVMG